MTGDAGVPALAGEGEKVVVEVVAMRIVESGMDWRKSRRLDAFKMVFLLENVWDWKGVVNACVVCETNHREARVTVKNFIFEEYN